MSDNMRFSEALSAFGGDRKQLIRILQSAQSEFSYISEDTIRRISEKMNIPVSEIYGVVTFYRQFSLNKPGRHIIKVCSGTACHVGGSEKLSELIGGMLSISSGETTEDGMFTLDEAACLGCCSLAPVMMIDGKVYGRLTEKKVSDIINSFREGDSI